MMKKLITIVLVSFLAINTSFAQLEEGTFILGAQSVLSEVDDEKAWSSVSLKPNVGYFISDQLVVGTVLYWNSGTEKDGIDSNGDPVDWQVDKSSELTIEPYVRYYISENMFVGLGLEVSTSSNKTTYSGDWSDQYDTKTSNFDLDLGLGGGMSFMWGDHICFEPMLGLSFDLPGSSTDYMEERTPDETIKTKERESSIELAISLNVSLLVGDF